jgi:hypothetical protein
MLLDTDCVFFQKLNADLVFNPTVIGELTSACLLLLEATVAISMMMSAHPSLLETIVAMGVLTSSHPSLLEATVVTGVLMSSRLSLIEFIVPTADFYPSLLCYHCSDVVVAMGRMPVAIVAYSPFLQCVI